MPGSSDHLRLLVLSNGSVGHTQRWVDYFIDRGDEVDLASFEFGIPTRAREHRLPALSPIKALRYPMAWPWARKLADRIRPDVVVGHFVPAYGLLAALVGHRPVVTVAWGSDILLNPARTRFHHWRVRYALERSDLVLSDARMLTRAIAELGVQPRRIETLTFGIDTDRFRPAEGEPADPPVILSYRQLLPLYHVDLLIRALPEVRARASGPFAVRIIGQGSERTRLIELSRQLGVSDVVTFVEGHLSDEELIREIQGASIYVSTSRSDSTSVSLLEAMACGVAPVVTDIEGNQEWIHHGENGLLVPVDNPAPLAESLIRLLHDPGERKRFLERNLRVVRSQGDWARNMARTRKLLCDLASERTD